MKTPLIVLLTAASLAMAGCASAPLLYNVVDCSSTQVHNISVFFQENGCLVPYNSRTPNNTVDPELVEVCPGDTVIWTAKRNNQISQQDVYNIFFSPLNRQLAPQARYQHVETIWASAPKGTYKYAIVARSLADCRDNSVDPRIKVDPR